MSKKKRFGVSQALNRGLTETIHVVEHNSGIFRHAVLPLSRIELDPDNPRKLFITLEDIRQGLRQEDPLYVKKQEELERLNELAITVKNSGVINPIIVYKRGDVYRVVAGERRCLASILAGKNEIDARVFNEKPKGFELKLVQWIENTAREDLLLHERLNNVHDLIQEYQHQHPETAVTATSLKNITGLSLSQATYYLSVLDAHEDVKKLIEEGKLHNLDKAAVLATINVADLRQLAIDACLAGCSLKELRQFVAQGKSAFKKHQNLSVAKKSGRGRAAKRVHLGFTAQVEVVKTIMESVLNHESYSKYKSLFSQIDWNQFEKVTQAFQRFIGLLETKVKG